MRSFSFSVCSTLALGGALLALACSDSGSTSPSLRSSGILVTRLTDAPFPTDQVQRVDIFVVRVDARVADVSDDEANQDVSDQSAASGGWKTVATPNASFDLLSLQNGIAATLGQAMLPAGTYDGFRLVIDQDKSSATLKTGMVLDGGSTPGIKFPSAGQSGIKIVLAQPVTIVANTETDLVVDFNVGQSFVLRGNTIDKNGLLFKPVVNASITNLALTNSNVRLANATDDALTLLQAGTALPGSSSITFGTSTACNSVNAAMPELSVTQGAATAQLPLSPSLTAGHPFTFVAFPGSTAGSVQFATIQQAITTAPGQAGLSAFNATAIAKGFDVYVTPPGGGTATFSNIAAGASSGSAVSVPAGTSQVRLTATGDTTTLLKFTQAFTAGQNTMLVIAPPAPNTTTPPRAFFVSAC